MLCRLLFVFVLLLNFVNSEIIKYEEEIETETPKRTGKFFGIFGFISGKRKI